MELETNTRIISAGWEIKYAACVCSKSITEINEDITSKMEGKKFDKQPPLCCTKDSILDEERLECVDANNNIVEPDKTESQA